MAALAASGALFLDAPGRVLVVEPGETPREACAQELLEGLGPAVEPGPLLVTPTSNTG
ncbi:hypothetical protein [Saccharothrix sp. NRRL B-16348]|uniref:hypothetical protein n=1 Tax=Saccharothrix sp. NRRL B-16348 TaxID=1415542 RepID=UPI000A609632|nr:hypothetical protein [Saccharothrix sp. NRRL B-16348]